MGSIVGGLLAILVFKGILVLFDRRAEQRVQKLYARHDNGVIIGLEPQQHRAGHSVAVILVHGYTDSPEVFDQITESLRNTPTDWYVPLLPFHGRNLQEMCDFDPYVLQSYVDALIQEKSRQYDKVIVVGQSIGGAIVSKIAAQNQWDPEKVDLVLMAPAVFLEKNSIWHRCLYQLYPVLRRYLFIRKSMSSDVVAKSRAKHAKNLKHYVTPSVKRLYRYSNHAILDFLKLSFPHTLFVASNDNRVCSKQLMEKLENSESCNFILLNGGKHLLYWSQHAPQIAQHLQQLVTQHHQQQP